MRMFFLLLYSVLAFCPALAMEIDGEGSFKNPKTPNKQELYAKAEAFEKEADHCFGGNTKTARLYKEAAEWFIPAGDQRKAGNCYYYAAIYPEDHAQRTALWVQAAHCYQEGKVCTREAALTFWETADTFPKGSHKKVKWYMRALNIYQHLIRQGKEITIPETFLEGGAVACCERADSSKNLAEKENFYAEGLWFYSYLWRKPYISYLRDKDGKILQFKQKAVEAYICASYDSSDKTRKIALKENARICATWPCSRGVNSSLLTYLSTRVEVYKSEGNTGLANALEEFKKSLL